MSPPSSQQFAEDELADALRSIVAAVAVDEFGDAAGAVIPETSLAAFDARARHRVDMRLEDGRLVVERVEPPARCGR